MINYLKNEVSLLKKFINASGLKDIDKIEDKLKKSVFDLQMIQRKLATCPTAQDFDNLQKKISQRVEKIDFGNLQKEVENCAKMSDIYTIRDGMNLMKKDVSSFVKMSEFQTRLNIYQTEFNEKLN